MDLSSIGHHVRKTDLLNRSGVTLFLIALLSLIAVYYSEAVDTETERSALTSNLGRYESVLQVEVQHLVDLIYRSSNQAFSPDTPAIANSFPWVRSIGQISKKETDVPKKNHLLTLSLAEVSQSLGGQITFATVNESDVLLVLSREGRDQTIRAVFPPPGYWSSSTTESIKRTWTSGLTSHRPIPPRQALGSLPASTWACRGSSSPSFWRGALAMMSRRKRRRRWPGL